MVSILLFMCHIFFSMMQCVKKANYKHGSMKQTSKQANLQEFLFFKINENACNRERARNFSFLAYFLPISTFSTKQTILFCIVLLSCIVFCFQLFKLSFYLTFRYLLFILYLLFISEKCQSTTDVYPGSYEQDNMPLLIL